MSPGADARHHLYIHVPFCRLVCAYCDFVAVAGRRADIPRYVDALLSEMAVRPAPGELRTIYFGGGTPSQLDTAHVERLVAAAMERWNDTPAEVSLEANPSARERPDWIGLRSAGVTRLSLGVQSLHDADLRELARGHSAGEAVAAYRAVRAAGFESVSLDLMYGIPGQTVAGWRRGVAAALALGPDQLSLYSLSLAVTPDEWAGAPRAGALRWRRAMAERQDDDVAAEQYRVAEELLDAAGFGHYELSSWARPGHECVHNRAYWERLPYTGLGAGAHSFDGTTRSWNVRDVDAYIAAVERGASPREDGETVDERESAFETLALALRTLDGLSRSAFRDRFGDDPATRYAVAVDISATRGLIELDADSIRLTPAGRLLANDVLVAFIG
ncbi:MAG: radical SAM family heme chaperone HemW [Candidatus Limnocylindria bacterium]